jgi:hypothetical protein
MSAADCERWENRLLDLAYGEIDEAEEREVRAHLDGCDHCQGALEKLSRGRALAKKLPQLEPPAAMVSAVLRAARDKALEIEAARAEAARDEEEAAAKAAPPEAAPVPEKSFWTWLVGVATSPQFAMVSLLVLTVGVGLWWFPGVTGHRPLTPPLVAEPTGATGTPEALAPAEPLRFDVDPRTGRVEPLAEGETERPERVVERTGRVRMPTPAAPTVSDDDGEEESGASAVASVTGVLVEDGSGAGTVIESPLPPSTAPSLGLSSTSPTGSAGSGLGAAERVGTLSTPGTGSATGLGRTAESPGVAGDEVEAPTVDGPTMLAAGLLRQARELARGGRDREAAVQYEALLSHYPTASEAPRAMLEVAEIYRRLGLVTRARRWLERAAEQPAVAAAARREMLRLDAAERSAVESATGAHEATTAPTSE